jgi:hypothetical protein
VPRENINLKISQCTANPTGTDIYKFGDQVNAEHISNTGIERGGGLTTLYEQETTFATAGANSIITASGGTLQVDASHNVRLNDSVIGNVGSWTVYKRGILPAPYLDAAWSSTGTLIGIKRAGNVITVEEYSPSTKTVTSTRSTTFAGFPAGMASDITLLKYVDMAYADAQEFIVTIYGGVSYLLRETGTTVTSLVNTRIQGWRFAALKYIFWTNNITASPTSVSIGDPSGVLTASAPGGAGKSCYIIIDRWNGLSDSRAVITFPVYKEAGNTLTGLGTVGYDGAGGYSGTIVYKGVALGAVTATITNPIVGFGYSECSYTRSDTGVTTYYILFQQPTHSATDYYQTSDIKTGLITVGINGYGKLNDIRGNLNSETSLRACFINGAQQYLSVGPITAGTTTYDAIGVPLTNVGEFDNLFTPHVVDNVTSHFSRIIYRYNGNIYYISINAAVGHTIDKISDTVYQVNCISVASIVDIIKGTLEIGTNDYNGRFIISNAGTTPKAVCVLKSIYCNSIDTGDKIGGALNILPGTLVGIDLPIFIDRKVNYEIDVYLNDAYFVSYTGVAIGAIDLSKIGLIYVPDTRLPIAMGYSYGSRTALTDIETIFTGVGYIGQPDIDYGYAGYELGNDIPGIYQSFVLFSQRYLFDGYRIWLAEFNGSLYSTKVEVCPAVGMQYIAVSPTAAYFLSSFDNSIYTFDGGRALTKSHRLNDLRNSADVIEPVTDGVYNVRDNTLLLQTAGSFVHISDGIVSQNFKKANQTSITIYDTTQGIQIANNTMKWRYSFFDIGSTTVVPLTFQSAYFGPLNDVMSKNTEFTLTLYSPSRGLATILVGCTSFDGDVFTPQVESITIQPSDWNSIGLYRCRIQPKAQMVVAANVGFYCSSKIVLTNISVEYEESVSVAPRKSRSV